MPNGSGAEAPQGAPGPARQPSSGPSADADSSLIRSSGVMALGTLASRVTGFMRTAVLVYALGTAGLADAYNNANTLPNTVYDLMLGGILTSVVVPLLVNAARRDTDGGEAYDQRIFTLGVLALGAITLVATLAAGLLVDLYAASVHGPEHGLMVVFAYFFVPQIFFYGVTSLAGAILNARGHFAAPMWTPVINNLIVIVILLMFMTVAGVGRTPGTISSGQVRLLGVGTTLGIIVQTAALIPALRRVGFRWHPRFDFRRAEVSEIGQMAGWMAGYIVTTQVAFLVTQNVANAAGVRAQAAHIGHGAGFSAYSYAWQLFQMPYAIIGISVITALLPRMSAHASERRYSLLRDDFSTGVRLSSVVVVPAALWLAVLAPPLTELLLAYGSTTVADASYLGVVFGMFALGLVPYMLFQLLLRVFYALHDSRTAMFIGLATMTSNIVVNLVMLNTLSPGRVVEGLAAGFGVSNLVGTAAAWWLLIRRVGSLDGRRIAASLIRMHLAAVPAMIFIIAMTFTVGVVLHPGAAYGLITVVVGGGGALMLYVLFAKAFGVAEVPALVRMVSTRFGGGRQVTRR